MTKSATRVDSLFGVPYQVDSIVETPAPDHGEGPWHRYVIRQGPNTITGVRQGTRAEVGLRLDDMVADLNERRLGKYRAKSKGGPGARRA